MKISKGSVRLTAEALDLLIWLETNLVYAQISRFEHVIVIVQENRTPDNLFQGLCVAPFGSAASCSTTPSGSQYDIQTTNWLDKYSPTRVTQPKPVPLTAKYDLGHGHVAFEMMCDLDPVTFVLQAGPHTTYFPPHQRFYRRGIFPE